jgi:hypothetical protein
MTTDKAAIPHISLDGFAVWGAPTRRLWAVHGDATSGTDESNLQGMKGSTSNNIKRPPSLYAIEWICEETLGELSEFI